MHSCGTNSQDSSEESQTRANLSDYTGTRPKFKFPPKTRLSKSVDNSSASDSSTSAQSFRTSKRRNNRKPSRLPPLGIFWDIENCQVPKNKSASAVVQRIRDFFLLKHREAEFLVVCDVKKERSQIIQELHDSQVNLIHVASTSKNAADEKLRQSLRRFAEVHPAPSCVVLISGDINFAADLSDLRYRKKIRVILVHNANVADALILCANEHYCYSTITEDLPKQKLKASNNESAYLQVSNLPMNLSSTIIKNRLNFLTNNCGGRVTEIMPEEGAALIKFCNQDFANRAQKRVQGEDVFGNKIKVVTPSLRSYSGRKLKGRGGSFQNQQLLTRSVQEAASRDSKRHPYDLMGQEFGVQTPSGETQEAGFQVAPSRLHKTSISSEYSDDGKMQGEASKSSQPVDLIISNFDPSFNYRELKKLVTNMLKGYAVLSLTINTSQLDNFVANVKVCNQQTAQLLISHLHRQRLGHKRIVISYVQSDSPNLEQLRAMVISVLQEVPDNHMPLFKFIELLESRYHYKVSVFEINKLKDICMITEKSGSRIISFAQEAKTSPTPNLSKTLLPYCTVHCGNGLSNLGWCELNRVQQPNVMISLKRFRWKLNELLDVHMGSMPLLSFQTCYEQELQEALPVDANGVALEHLITCVTNIEIAFSGPSKNIKVIRRETKSAEVDEESALKSVAPALALNITLLCRELEELLKTTDKCQLPLSKFIPAYHHHFGRQCHVGDYGYTKLIDLFESISHVIQIMGDGTRKIITLSHKAQMRRFTSDLLRVLKNQPAKQISMPYFPAAFQQVMNKAFNPVDYGLCTFKDLLEEVPEHVIVFTRNKEDEIVIAVPKREQTAVEKKRTKHFAMEVIDILKHAPYCTILFNKFVPAYHHHFGYQCRVSDYGFSKLIELFEAIPNVVKIQELQDGERTVSLTMSQSLKVLAAQIMGFIQNSPSSSISLENLPQIYLKECGYPLKPQMYECESIPEVIDRIAEYVQVIPSNAGSLLIPVDADFISTLKIRTWALLLNAPFCKNVATFKYEYQSRYNSDFPLNNLKQLRNVVSLSQVNDTNYITLTELYKLAAQLYHVLFKNGGSIIANKLEKYYERSFYKVLRLEDYNINSIDELYEMFDFLFFTEGYKEGFLALNRNLSAYQIPLPLLIYNPNHLWKNWPQSPQLQKIMPHLFRKNSAPKPDTPPTPASSNNSNTSPPWNSFDSVLLFPFSLQLPINEKPQFFGNPFDLLSPARNPWGRSPDPAALPMPDKLMKNCDDDSHDSGVNSKLELSDTEVDALAGTGAKRRVPNYLSFDK